MLNASFRAPPAPITNLPPVYPAIREPRSLAPPASSIFCAIVTHLALTADKAWAMSWQGLTVSSAALLATACNATRSTPSNAPSAETDSTSIDLLFAHLVWPIACNASVVIFAPPALLDTLFLMDKIRVNACSANPHVPPALEFQPIVPHALADIPRKAGNAKAKFTSNSESPSTISLPISSTISIT